jgi:protocatechuate 3,4-dioxygenase alpha subunit
VDLVATASQTVGPFFHLGLTGTGSIGCIAEAKLAEESVSLICRVFDSEGQPVDDALIEIWQADGRGNYPSPDRRAEGFRGFGRLPTLEGGSCTFETIKPGRVRGPDNSLQAPHLILLLFARGLLNHLVTRVYFAGDPANAGDPILALVPPERRDTLMAQPDPSDVHTWRFDIHLRGACETVFFDV